MIKSGTQFEAVRLSAMDHLDAEGSVIRSGRLLADAVLKHVSIDRVVVVSFSGLKGAASSYFNVFLRRIQEVCGLAVFDSVIQLEFGTSIQKQIFDRSWNAMQDGLRNSPID